MHIHARKTLKIFWEKNPDAEKPLKDWYRIVKNANWETPADVKRLFGNASIVANDRVVFNIAGNKYRLVVKMHYNRGRTYVRFIGTHAEYDKIDVTEI